MPEGLATLNLEPALLPSAALDLDHCGFVVVPGLVRAGKMERLSTAYDAAIASATGDDIRLGTTSTRVSDFVNRGVEFDDLYLFPPLLEACHRTIGNSFKLSSFQARTLRPGAAGQELHVDVPRDSADWPLVGFIVMIDDFRPDNGATRFLPGSHRRFDSPTAAPWPGDDNLVPACGVAGSVLIFNGSTWHGHGTNSSSRPRRSLQGAFIPRGGRSGTDFAARMDSATRARLTPLARHLLALP